MTRVLVLLVLPLLFAVPALAQGALSEPVAPTCTASSTLSPERIVGPAPPTRGEVECVEAEPVGGIQALMRGLRYPAQARRAHAQGTVHSEVDVDAEGLPLAVTVVRSPHPALDVAAQEALLRAAFTPATVDGVPVRSVVSVPLTFRMRDGAGPRPDPLPRGQRPR